MPNYEKIKLANGDVTELHYIGGGDGLAAIYVVNIPLSGGAGVGLYYTYTDHLGSITTLTDANATIVYEQNFDAWGRERNPKDWGIRSYFNEGVTRYYNWQLNGGTPFKVTYP